MTRKTTKKRGTKPGYIPIEYDKSTKQVSNPRQAHAIRAYKLALLGTIDADIETAFGISNHTLTMWKRKYPEFADWLNRGKKEANADVVEALYKKAIGYSHPDIHIAVVNGQIKKVPITKHYPPDTSAIRFFLKNRTRDDENPWTEVLSHEHSGKNGAPISIKKEIDLSDFTDAELDLIMNAGLKIQVNENK
jgi:hypothetical protein